MRLIRLFLYALFFLYGFQTAAQRYDQQPPLKTRVLLVLDGSGSMLGKLDNQQLKINVAKNILSDLIDSLKVNKDVELALRVYGHQYASKLKNCKDSKLEVPFRQGNHYQIINKLKGLLMI